MSTYRIAWCSYCGGRVPESAKYCPHCGGTFSGTKNGTYAQYEAARQARSKRVRHLFWDNIKGSVKGGALLLCLPFILLGMGIVTLFDWLQDLWEDALRACFSRKGTMWVGHWLPTTLAVVSTAAVLVVLAFGIYRRVTHTGGK